MSGLADFGVRLLGGLLGQEKASDFLVNRLVNAGRSRPHPWSTLSPFTSWRSLTDRSFYARFLPADSHFPLVDQIGTRRPPTAQLVQLFKAVGNQRPCPKSTCLFPAFAQYLTDGFIRTKIDSDNEPNSLRRETTTNHDIDLSPLYGRVLEHTRILRLKSEVPGQKGRLKSQMIGDQEYSPWLFKRDGSGFDDEFEKLDKPMALSHATPLAKLTLFAAGGDRVNAAPQTAMMNTLFLREHNRLARLMEAAHPEWDDEQVFQTARNTVIVIFMKIVVEEYINHISSAPFTFRAHPQVAYDAKWNRPNWITIEFALLYRWHSLVPATARWGGQNYGARDLVLNNKPLVDGGLAAGFADMSDQPATMLGLQNSVDFLLGAEKHAIEQARINQVASYDDYRKAMGKKPMPDFETLVGKGATAEDEARLRQLAAALKLEYGDIDNVEFYIGLFAEKREKNSPLPALMTSMVAMDAFSHAYTNPLFSQHIWGDAVVARQTFSAVGLDAFNNSGSLADILKRNVADPGDRFVGMTRRNWQRE